MKKILTIYPYRVYFSNRKLHDVLSIIMIRNIPNGGIRNEGLRMRQKERSPKEYKDLMNRLKRIEGQVRGIQGMIEKDAYCADVLIQVAAVNAALNSFSKVLLSNHIHSCVAENIRAGNDEVIDELVILLEKLMR